MCMVLICPCSIDFQSVAHAKQYFKRRIEYLTQQMEKLQPAMQEKYKMKQGRNKKLVIITTVMFK